MGWKGPDSQFTVSKHQIKHSDGWLTASASLKFFTNSAPVRDDDGVTILEWGRIVVMNAYHPTYINRFSAASFLKPELPIKDILQPQVKNRVCQGAAI
jgi:hypothetical protein